MSWRSKFSNLIAWFGPAYVIAIVLCRYSPYLLGFNSFDQYKVIWDIGSILIAGTSEPTWPISPFPPLLWVLVWPLCVGANYLLISRLRILLWKETTNREQKEEKNRGCLLRQLKKTKWTIVLISFKNFVIIKYCHSF